MIPLLWGKNPYTKPNTPPPQPSFPYTPFFSEILEFDLSHAGLKSCSNFAESEDNLLLVNKVKCISAFLGYSGIIHLYCIFILKGKVKNVPKVTLSLKFFKYGDIVASNKTRK